MPSNPQLKAELKELQVKVQELAAALTESNARADEAAKEAGRLRSEAKHVTAKLAKSEALVQHLREQLESEKAKPPVIKRETVTKHVPADTSHLEYKLKQTERERDKWRSLAKK